MFRRRTRRRVHRWGRVAMVGALVSAGVVACATTTEPRGPGADPAPADAPVIDPAAGEQLCEMMRADVDNWRQEGSAMARVKFNGAVHTWALRHGAINVSIARHRDAIDAVARERCPDAREQITQILGTEDLASGLVGF
ncbi:hypothetical protein [Nocardia sp. NPDC058633]|uniref:hypothetical protein n=1 Tax=Nocardia sp. NPDC058633 TaxID=3346568 RepID=UPI0036605D2A